MKAGEVVRNNENGLIFRIHRKDKNRTIAELSNKVKIAESKLSDFENGKRVLPDELIGRLYHELDIVYKPNEKAEPVMKDSVDNLCNLIIYGQEYEEAYQKHVDMKEEVQCSKAYITYLLVIFIYNIYKENKFFDYKKHVQLLMDHTECLTVKNQQVLYDTVGVYYRNIKDFDKAQQCFEKGIRIGGLSEASAMILYHLAGTFVIQGQTFEALKCLESAKRKFDQELIFDRSLMCSVEMATIQARLGSYEESEKLYLKCLLAAKSAHWSLRRLITIYNNLLWHYLLDGEYQKILAMSDEALSYDPENPDISSIVAYAYWRTNDLKNAKHRIQIAKANIANSYENGASFIEAINALIMKKSSDMIEKRLNQMFQSSEKYMDSQMQMLALDLLIEWSIQHKNYEKECEYKTKLIDVIKNVYKKSKIHH